MANIMSLDNRGQTPLHCASGNGKLDVAEYLISVGAQVNFKDSSGKTPLHDASKGGHLDCVKLLISKGATVDVQNTGGNTPLHWASREGKLDVVKYLVESGHANVTLPNNAGTTPLVDASVRGHVDVFEFLEKVVPADTLTPGMGLITRIIQFVGAQDLPALHRIPDVTDTFVENDQPVEGTFDYQAALGMLTFLCGHTRCELGHAVSHLSRFAWEPKRCHEAALIRVVRYLKGSLLPQLPLN